MVPKLHAKGTSFKGAATYLLHDKGRASTAQRLAWVETRNLATDEPQVAWRVMAATAMDQDRLKDQAGIKNTGRKSKATVLHFSLSWHAEEKDQLSREEMLRAAQGAIRSLKAEDRQALIVSHSDEPQPHVHVLLNRVSAEDGRLLSSSKEKLALSKWAQRYEEERGKIYCEERVLNNAARARGEFTRAAKDTPRNIHEAEAPANDNSARAFAIQKEQQEKAAALAATQREAQTRHKAALLALASAHKERLAALAREAQRQATMARDQVRREYRPIWERTLKLELQARETFAEREQWLFGRAQNAFKAIDFGAILRGEDRRAAIKEAFTVLASSGARLDALRREQEQRAARILAEQRAKEDQAAGAVEAKRQEQQQEARRRYLEQRSAALLERRMDEAAGRAAWRARAQDRREAWEPLRREQQRRAKSERYAHSRAAEQSARGRDLPEERNTEREALPGDRPEDQAPTRPENETPEEARMRRYRAFAARQERIRGHRRDRGPDRDIER